MSEATQRAIESAISVARDLAEGRIAADGIEAEVIARCRDLVSTVIGPEDPLWPVQLDIARQVLALDGIPKNELAEWAAVCRARTASDE